MDCDSVFFILTSGPFPTGRLDDDLIEQHIARCECCRMLSEALRPAPDLFHESLSPQEEPALPSYHSLPTPETCIVGETLRAKRAPHAGRHVPAKAVSIRCQEPTRWHAHISVSEPLFQRDYLTVLSFLSVLCCALFGIGWVAAG